MAGFPEAKVDISPNGWINTDVFMSCLRDCYVPAVAPKRKPVVQLIDGHTSHTSNTEVIGLCIKEQILLYCLKSHASHIIQPLDQSEAMKQAWGEQCQKIMNETGKSECQDLYSSAETWLETPPQDLRLLSIALQREKSIHKTLKGWCFQTNLHQAAPPSPATVELASASAANIKRLLYPERIDQLFVEYTWHWGRRNCRRGAWGAFEMC